MEVVTRHTSRKAGPLAGIIFIIVGIVMIPMLGSFKEKANASESWPTAPGVITVSEILSFQSTDSEGKTKTMYRENIAAKYVVEGNTYSSDGLNIMSGNSSTSSRNSVKKKTDAYPLGREVSVYYNPEEPSYGILEPGLPIFLRMLFFIPYFAIIVGVLVLAKGILRLVKLAAAVGVMAGEKKAEQPAPAPQSEPASEPAVHKTAGKTESDVGTPAPPTDGDDDGFSL